MEGVPYPEGSYFGVKLHSNDPSLEGVMVQVAYLVSGNLFSDNEEMGQSMALVTGYGSDAGVKIICKLLPWSAYKLKYVDLANFDIPYKNTYTYMQIRLTFNENLQKHGTVERVGTVETSVEEELYNDLVSYC